MNKRVEELIILNNLQLNHDTHLIEFQVKDELNDIYPGQFVNILVKDSPSTFLRRPFSFLEVDPDKGIFSVLIKAVGMGTKKLVSMQKGEFLDIIYPLGNRFTIPASGEKVLLVGGGVGIAPMLQMAKESKKSCADVHVLLGARSSCDHVLLDRFGLFGQLYITTQDGSMGVKGFVVDHPILKSDQSFDRIYCCGPEPMMQAIARIASDFNTDCEVSLENTMACGFGVCLCCVTKTNEGHQCVCTDGPVFNTKKLQWLT
jgi:dihydroorotate dehydrogenase electron transfer subunit